MSGFKLKRNGEVIDLAEALAKKEGKKEVLTADENEIITNATSLLNSQMAILLENTDEEEGLNKAQWKRLNDIITMLKTLSKRRLEQSQKNVLDDMSAEEINQVVLEAQRTLGLVDDDSDD